MDNVKLLCDRTSSLHLLGADDEPLSVAFYSRPSTTVVVGNFLRSCFFIG